MTKSWDNSIIVLHMGKITSDWFSISKTSIFNTKQSFAKTFYFMFYLSQHQMVGIVSI